MVFTTKKIDSTSLGEILRKARAKRVLSLEGASKLSGVQTRYLERIESEEFEKLPAEVYTRCFLKRYAEILGISPKKILNLYENELNLKKSFDSRKTKKQDPKRVHQGGWAVNPRIINFFLLIALGVIIFGYAIYQLNFILKAPQVALENPVQDSLSTNEASIEIVGWVKHASSLTINNEEVYIGEDGYFREEVDLKEGLNIIYIEARNRFRKTSEARLEVFRESP